MSDRPTPETDANSWCENWSSNSEFVTAAFARKLERQRDEARRERDKAIIKAREQNAKLREEARLYCQNSDFHREMREKAERERDEARQQNAKLREELAQLKEGAQ